MVGIRAVRELLRAEPRLRFLRMFLANKEPAREVTGLLAADVLPVRRSVMMFTPPLLVAVWVRLPRIESDQLKRLAA